MARKMIATEDGYTLEGVDPSLTIVRNDYRGFSVASRGNLAVARSGRYGYSMFRLRRTAAAFVEFISGVLSNERLTSFREEVYPTADERHAITAELERLLIEEGGH